MNKGDLFILGKKGIYTLNKGDFIYSNNKYMIQEYYLKLCTIIFSLGRQIHMSEL